MNPRLTSPTRGWTRSKKIYNPTACRMELTKLEKKRWQRHIFQVKEQDENTEIISEVGTGQKEFRVIIVKMIKELWRRRDAQKS